MRAQALHRWRVLRAHLEDGVPLPRAASEAEVALRTAQRWLTRYRAEGLAGLARAPRADRGTRLWSIRCIRTAKSSPRRHIWFPQPPATSRMGSCAPPSDSRTR